MITSETMLLRQIHPSFMQNNYVTSQAFRPTPKDERQLSVYNGDVIEPQDAFEHYTQQLGNKSVGVLGILVAECQELSLPVKEDPEPFPEHAIIDFSESTVREVKTKAKKLRHWALERGWLYRDE